MVPADPVRFAAAARRLGVEARRRGLAVPGFRSPPRLPGGQRSIRRRPDGAMVVAVRVHGRTLEAVVTDMVEGVLAANRSAPGDVAELRAALLEAVLGEEEASAA
ncbi:MAG: hypothetical protein QOG43_1794 [Actinomycetota bacterium]|nr:hypothetical protein [Actinomycetota bacterium]